MRTKFLIVFVCCVLFPLTSSFGEVKAVKAVADSSPSIVVPSNSYEFPMVTEGIQVTHDFIVQNKGDAELKIIKVKTG